MSKLKIIDMNKQLMDKSKQTVARMESLQNSVQTHLATLKRREGELIKIAWADAEEKRNRQLQEELEQAQVNERTYDAVEATTVQVTSTDPLSVTEPLADQTEPKAVVNIITAESVVPAQVAAPT